MLLDVDLELSVSFGHTTLVLQEVLKLSSGSIVELNRSANDPVELLVNNAVVARGEVVVVDGNYGIRITEVVSARERIRSLL
jgi:flagellar motor switch protein FliN/FliY